MKYRYEQFGGIIASDDPPFLAFVDRDYMAGCGLPPSGLWEGTPLPPGILTAPTEVHFAVTNRCSAGCSHCYMDGGNPDPGELDTGQMKAALEILAGMGVFHIAMGGGEALEREDLFELAEYARGCGLVPNLTVSGRGITAENAASMKVFGQVNISLDGVGINSGIYRGTDQFETADRAFRLLREHGMQPGINCVLGRKNLKDIGNLFRYARSREVEEIEFLRFKPSGRGKADYLDNRLTYEQNILLAALLADSSKRYGVTAKIDCSLVPMLCYSLPGVDLLEALGTYGCEAGNVLLGIRSNGTVSGCSFLEESPVSVFDLPKEYGNLFSGYRQWTEKAPEPCRSCRYLQICKGGCHAVSRYLFGDEGRPDPDCPFVIEYELRNAKPNHSLRH